MATGLNGWRDWTWRDWTRWAAPLAGLALAVAVLAWAGIALPREVGRTTPLWPANALVLAALLRTRDRRGWPALLAAGLAGNIAADLLSGDAVWLSLALSGCNTLEVGLGAWMLGRLAPRLGGGGGEGQGLARWPDLLAFGLTAGIAAPLICASLATGFLQLAFGPRDPFTLLTWAAADGLGVMVFTPLLLTLGDIRRQLSERPVSLMGVLALVALACVCVAVFWLRLPMAFLIPLTLLAATFQLEMLGAVLGVLIVAIAALAMTFMARTTLVTLPGVPLPGGLTAHMLLAQVFLLTMILISLPTAVVLAQRRRLQASAAEQQRLARLAEDIAGLGYWRLEAADLSMTWSEGLFRLYGLAPGERAVIDAGNDMIDPEDRAAIRRKMARSLKTGEPFQQGFTVTRSDGSVRRMEGRALCETDETGRVTAIVGTTIDVTEQADATAAVARSEARFRALAASAPDIICESNLEGVYTYVSPACLEITGFTPEEMIGQSLHKLVHPDDVEHVQRICRALFANRDAPPKVYVEFRANRKDGGVVWLESRPVLSRDPATGRVIGFIDCARDITTRKALEAELEKARLAAIEAAEVKAAFLANMSHELRTPLTSVLGFTRLALDQPELGPVSRDYIRKASNGGAALLATVNDILDFSKLEAGQVEIRPRPTEAVGLIRDTLELFSESAALKGLTLSLTVKDLPEALTLDPDRLRQLLLNLVGNAVKFSEAGEVRVEAAWSRRRLKVSVIDQGPGLSKDQQALLFLRFSQIDGSTTRRHGGTGLGLAICRGLVEAMGGSIGVKSAPGQGARFHFEIPAAPAEAIQAGDAPAPAAIVPPGSRVLVVDDHRVNRELVRAILGPLGAELTEAQDGAEAVAQAAAGPFDLILMDLRMPGLDGTGAMRAIRTGSGPNAATPILAFSADADSTGEALRRAMGFDGDILKPLIPANLVALAAHHLAKTSGQAARAAVA
ncbi:PAS domain S-box-containing protein [Caulobacter ginsengisoli]|uniref:histidine kinase n=1 Tax=Caulobacter ginsengisoli TaxID=400775 RepID=A0ABU0IX09_9CAUL|nr:PAS domain S-box protein [Caulobacter ginsengisoli]MDQ0465482.1 PAS domain S-box-containing protein [Caulobacter ginsengisoli]